jgi:hypothetical protein
MCTQSDLPLPPALSGLRFVHGLLTQAAPCAIEYDPFGVESRGEKALLRQTRMRSDSSFANQTNMAFVHYMRPEGITTLTSPPPIDPTASESRRQGLRTSWRPIPLFARERFVRRCLDCCEMRRRRRLTPSRKDARKKKPSVPCVFASWSETVVRDTRCALTRRARSTSRRTVNADQDDAKRFFYGQPRLRKAYQSGKP